MVREGGNMKRVDILIVLCGLLIVSLSNAGSSQTDLLDQAKQHFSPLPLVFETPDNPLTPAKVALGKLLFYDPRVSADGSSSCFKCHWTNLYFTDGLKTSIGGNCRPGPRNSPTVLNAAGEISQHWVGNRSSVEDQAKHALAVPGSYGHASYAEAEKRIRELGYTRLFQDAFPGGQDPVTADHFAQAVGAFERTLSTPSRFDEYLNGNTKALTAAEAEGLKAFMQIGCAGCHNGAPVGGRMYQKFGVKQAYWELTKSEKPDEGRFTVTQNPSDRYVFKVPPLRNVQMTAPYFHDGSVARLEDAVAIMARLQLGKTLSDAQAASIIDFLDVLTAAPYADALVVPLIPSGR